MILLGYKRLYLYNLIIKNQKQMKIRSLLIALAAMTVGSVAAQSSSYVPLVREGVTWKYRANQDIMSSYLAQYIVKEAFIGDTVINGVTYKKLYATPYETIDVAVEKPVAFMRQDGRQVYGLYANDVTGEPCCVKDMPNGEKMFYDFANPANLGYHVDSTCYTSIAGHECLTYAVRMSEPTRLIEGYGIDGAGDLSFPGTPIESGGFKRYFSLSSVEEGGKEVLRGKWYIADGISVSTEHGVNYKKASTGANCLAAFTCDSLLPLSGSQVKIASSLKLENHPFAVTEIADDAFAGKSAVNYLEIPASVTRVGARAFSGTSLATIYNRSAVPQSVGEGAFAGVDKSACRLYVPQGSVEAYKAAPEWKDFIINPEYTGVGQNVAAKAVAGVDYISPSGVKSAQPQPGVNIVVTTYTDGSRTVSKQLH